MPTRPSGGGPGCEVELPLPSPTGTAAREQGARVAPGEGQRDSAGPRVSFPTGGETNETIELASLFLHNLLGNMDALSPSLLNSIALPKLG